MRDPQPDAAAPAVKLWYLAAMAGMEELDDPWALTTATNPAQLDLQHLRRELEPGGHVAVALRLFPDEPRFRLAQIEAAEWPVDNQFLTPADLEFTRAHARERVPSSPQTPDERWAFAKKYLAARVLAHLDELPAIEKEYQHLEAFGSLRAEIELHVGYNESALMHWSNALDHLRLVPAYTTERFLQYLSEYFIGRTLQNMGEHASARGAFENAVAMIPGARAASTQLAVELLLTDNHYDRERAYSLLLAANSDSAPPDPWEDFRKGDARLWPVYMARLREALR
jgi:tetratricopeptide (TPR) repeat protein